MNYYELLDVPTNATTDEIKQHYRKFAKVYHPDKGGDAEQFKRIHEAYETLMDPIKRHQYDMDLSGSTYTFTQSDYEVIYKYYHSFINSVEVRLMMSLFYRVPKDIRSKVNLSTLFTQRPSSTTMINTSNIKIVDATQLYDNITLHLKRTLHDVFTRVCKQIIVKTRTTYHHLFITDSDYDMYLYNNVNSGIKLELTTVPDHTFYKRGYDLCYIKKLDIYELYYGTTFSITLPNKYTICCNANQLTKKKSSFIDTFGFYNPTVKKRGRLHIIYQLVHPDIDGDTMKDSMKDSMKQTMKELFHKKEIFIDPRHPVYEI
jgi:DnaJ-class molecular chaperone